MNLENKTHFSEICRICLKNYATLLDLFKTEAPDMLNFCGFLKVIEGDDLPNKICELCNTMLLQSFKLKQLCLDSESYFKDLIGKKTYLQMLSTNEGNTIAASMLDSECLQTPEEESSEGEPLKNIDYLHTCSECQFSFSSEKLFGKHSCNISAGKDQSVLPSNECGANKLLLQSDSDLDVICKEKVNEKTNASYICPKCKVSFEHKQDFSVHQSIHSDKDPTCNVCNKLFRTMKMLKRHVKTHMISKPHVCNVCDKGFSESPALDKHMKLNHLRLPREKKYACEECGQRFTDKYYLNVHTRKHTGEKPFECKICDKSFNDPRSYKVHMNVHEGKKPYLCSHCGKAFVQSSHHRQHLLVHTKQKPYSCDICKKRFTQSTSLQRHQKILSGQFYCCICLESFSNKQQFLEHKEDHFH